MKREFITKLLPDIPKDILDSIMDENGKDIETAKAPITTLTTERDDLNTRLTEASKKLEGYDPDWKAKAEQADKDAKAKIAGMEQDVLIRDALGGYKFTSAYARDGVADKVKKAGLKMGEDGKSLLGLDDLMKSIQTESPDAFKTEDKAPGRFDSGHEHGAPLGTDLDKFAAAAMKGAGLKTD
jgi:hypothetical protein